MARKPWAAVQEEGLPRSLDQYRVRCLPELEDVLRAKVPDGESLGKEAVLYFSRAPRKRLRGLHAARPPKPGRLRKDSLSPCKRTAPSRVNGQSGARTRGRARPQAI